MHIAKRVLIYIAIFIPVWEICYYCVQKVENAEAREYATPSEGDFNSETGPDGGHYAFVQNPDGTYTEWYWYGKENPEKLYTKGSTYSAEQMSDVDRVITETGDGVGSPIGHYGGVEGELTSDQYYEKEFLTDLRSEGTFADSGQSVVGSNIIEDGVSDGVLPTIPEIVEDSAAGIELGPASPETDALAAAPVVGFAIGEGIDELLGWPKLGVFFGESTIEEEGGGGLTEEVWESAFTGHEQNIKIQSVSNCEPEWQHHIVVLSEEAVCVYPALEYHYNWQYTFKGERHEYHEDGCWLEHGGASLVIGGDYYGIFPMSCGDLVPHECPIVEAGSWLECLQNSEGNYSEELPYGTLENVIYDSMPAEGLREDEVGVIEPSTKVVTRPERKTSIPVPPPADIPSVDQDETIHKEKNPDGSPWIKPLEEGSEIPQPSETRVPEPGTNELYEDYVDKLAENGLVPEKDERPESDIDPNIGPERVITTVPAPDTEVEPRTKVRVEINPKDAPEPVGEVPHPVGPPTLPGFDLPNFEILCKGFPFGVPCWLAKTIEGWSATKVAPEWGIENFEVEGHKIGGAKFKLAQLEPIMEIVRPVMIVFATIGLVLLFFLFAKGGSPPSGAGIPDTEPWMSLGETSDEDQLRRWDEM